MLITPDDTKLTYTSPLDLNYQSVSHPSLPILLAMAQSKSDALK